MNKHNLFYNSVSVCGVSLRIIFSTGLCDIRWESWPAHTFSVTIVICTRRTCNTYITAGSSNAIYITLWFYRSPFLLAVAGRHANWHCKWDIFLSNFAQPNWSGCWIGAIGASRPYINTVAANISAKARKSTEQQSPFNELIGITFQL